MRRYVIGFMFDPEQHLVVLIKKNRPWKQKGLLNGIGGLIEEGETPFEAMSREFREETGVCTDPKSWLLFHKEIHPEVVDGVLDTKELLFFACESEKACKAHTTTDEEIFFQYVGEKGNILQFAVKPMMYNLGYLVPMAKVFLSAPYNRQIVRTE